MTYVVYGLNSGTTSAVKRAVLGHFTDEKVSQAKDILFENCEKEIIGDKKKRVTTSARSNTEANLDDVIAAIQLLGPKRKLPTFAVSACDMSNMPRSHPEEINNISMADRMNRLEETVEALKGLVDRTLTENSQIKEELKELKSVHVPLTYTDKIKIPPPPSYADKIKTPSSTEGLYYSKPLSVTMPSSSVIMTRRCSKSDPSDGSENNKGDVSSPSNIKAAPAVPSSQKQQNPTSAITPASQDGKDGWQDAPRRRRKRRVVTGVGSDERITGAPVASRHLFIYRIQHTVSLDDLTEYLINKHIDVRSLKRISHDDSKYRSFHLETGKEDYKRLLDINMWPSGVCVRTFIDRRHKE